MTLIPMLQSGGVGIPECDQRGFSLSASGKLRFEQGGAQHFECHDVANWKGLSGEKVLVKPVVFVIF
jgi:hypothetical protein